MEKLVGLFLLRDVIKLIPDHKDQQSCYQSEGGLQGGLQ